MEKLNDEKRSGIHLCRGGRRSRMIFTRRFKAPALDSKERLAHLATLDKCEHSMPRNIRSRRVRGGLAAAKDGSNYTKAQGFDRGTEPPVSHNEDFDYDDNLNTTSISLDDESQTEEKAVLMQTDKRLSSAVSYWLERSARFVPGYHDDSGEACNTMKPINPTAVVPRFRSREVTNREIVPLKMRRPASTYAYRRLSLHDQRS